MPTAIIQADRVTKSFEGVAAVDDLSLEIANNEFVALLGPSGCGKTTLLRLIAGLEKADGGKILIGGQDMTATPPYQRPINLMFQSYALFPHMSVADNVAFGLKQDGLEGDALKARVGEALAMVDLQALALRKPHQLSGGQQQRVALARCIAKRPKVLLLDEPMAALDRALRERTRLELMNLRKRLGISFIVVTHDQEDAMTMADRVAVMDKGKIAQVGSPRALYETPGNRLVASFFGDSNVWDGTVGADGQRVRCDALGLDVLTQSHSAATGTPVAISVRPERIHLNAASEGNVLSDGTVEDIIYLGNITTYLVRVPQGALIRIASQNGAATFERGTKVNLSWPASAVVVLTS